MGVKLIYLDIDTNEYFDLKKVFKKIYSLGIHKLLVECGKDLTMKILSKKFFNEFYLFKSNKKLINKDKININNIVKELDKNYKNKKYVKTFLDKDSLIQYY